MDLTKCCVPAHEMQLGPMPPRGFLVCKAFPQLCWVMHDVAGNASACFRFMAPRSCGVRLHLTCEQLVDGDGATVGCRLRLHGHLLALGCSTQEHQYNPANSTHVSIA